MRFGGQVTERPAEGQPQVHPGSVTGQRQQL